MPSFQYLRAKLHAATSHLSSICFKSLNMRRADCVLGKQKAKVKQNRIPIRKKYCLLPNDTSKLKLAKLFLYLNNIASPQCIQWSSTWPLTLHHDLFAVLLWEFCFFFAPNSHSKVVWGSDRSRTVKPISHWLSKVTLTARYPVCKVQMREGEPLMNIKKNNYMLYLLNFIFSSAVLKKKVSKSRWFACAQPLENIHHFFQCSTKARTEVCIGKLKWSLIRASLFWKQ